MHPSPKGSPRCTQPLSWLKWIQSQIVWHMKIGLLVREGVCVYVCVCVSGNACGYFISHPWEEELHLYVMGFICVHVLYPYTL